MINICNTINCPFSGKDGCTRYISALHCHLRDKDLNYRKYIIATEYWLYSEKKLENIKEYNNEFITNDEGSQLQLARKQRIKKK